jgi:two-component system, cell cycle sensor histidine kinase and response regulator CckA
MRIAVVARVSNGFAPPHLPGRLFFEAGELAAIGPAAAGEPHVADIPLPMWIYDAATLRVHAVNQAALVVYGYSQAEFLALTADQLRPADDRAAFLCHLERAVDRPARSHARHLTRDGRVLQVDVIADPLVVGGRSARRVIVVDASARVEVEDECSRLGQAVEQAAESIVITDPQGTILYVNPAFERVSGYARAEVTGGNPRLLKSGRQDGEFYAAMWAALRRGEVWRGRLVNRRKDGTLFEEEATISPVRADDGTIRSYVAVKRDVSRERNLEEQVRQSAKMEAVGRLAGGVAHDFNNLLNVISGYAELGLRRLPPESDARRHVGEILRAAERAAGLTRQLLAFSRRQVLQPRVIDLNEVVRDMHRLLLRLIGEDVDLATRTADGSLSVLADTGQIEQVIMNLVVNARDAMPDGGRLLLETGAVDVDPFSRGDLPPGPHVSLSVADTGCGMDAETVSHIFEPFFTTKPEGKGTGLGLSTVWGIVNQSGGTVTVESRLGAGTTFRVLLPRLPAAGPATPGRPHHAEATPSARLAPVEETTGGATVLVVDDEAPLRAIVRDVLEGAGYRVREAADGEAALTLLAGRDPVDLLVTDMAMPGMDGATLGRRARRIKPGLSVLVMSGDADQARVSLPDAQGFLTKPFTTAGLEQAVRDALAAPAV